MLKIPPQLLDPENILVTLAFSFAIVTLADKLLGRWPPYARWLERMCGSGSSRIARPGAHGRLSGGAREQ